MSGVEAYGSNTLSNIHCTFQVSLLACELRGCESILFCGLQGDVGLPGTPGMKGEKGEKGLRGRWGKKVGKGTGFWGYMGIGRRGTDLEG